MRFDVYAMPRGGTPYVVDVQSDFLSHLESRMVIPILLEGKVEARIASLHPVCEIGGHQHVLVTNQ